MQPSHVQVTLHARMFDIIYGPIFTKFVIQLPQIMRKNRYLQALANYVVFAKKVASEKITSMEWLS